MADHFLDARVREGRGARIAVRTDERSWTFAEVQTQANRVANLLQAKGVRPEERVILALDDGPEFVIAFFGVLKLGAVVVMLNPELNVDKIEGLYDYTRARAAFVSDRTRGAFETAGKGARFLDALVVTGTPEFETELEDYPDQFDNFRSHRDDPAVWLFSGGTTGLPKAVVQTHRSFANTTYCYGQETLRFAEDDVTLSVPKLYFGYATGSNLLFPFSVGASIVLFPERCTAECLFEKIALHRPTILITVPTMIKNLLDHPTRQDQDFGSLRLATSAGEALPVKLHHRWTEAFGVDLLDGFGTAEMWHIFISNRPGDIRPGTLGKAVTGFDLRVCSDEGEDLPTGQTGWLWVRGDSRALGYWQEMEKTRWGFRGDWYVTGDMVARDEDGYLTYHGRADDMLKVSGKWLAIREVEECLQRHPAVKEAVVVGVDDGDGLTKPYGFVVAADATRDLEATLQEFVKTHLEPFKYPRRIEFFSELPRTHLGKVDRGRLRKEQSERNRK